MGKVAVTGGLTRSSDGKVAIEDTREAMSRRLRGAWIGLCGSLLLLCSAVSGCGDSMPRLQDMFQTFLRELRPEDLQGSQGSYQLRAEIQRRVNLVIAPAKVNAVLIEEMLIN